MGPFLFVVLFLAVAALILGLLALVLWLAFRFFRMLWRWTRSDQIILRSLILLSAAALLASPVIAYKLYERAFVLGRVPAPLEVAEVEYQLEQSWGIGGPGDNETGFVIYRLDDASARWAVDQGQNLATLSQADRRCGAPRPSMTSVRATNGTPMTTKGRLVRTNPTSASILANTGSR